MLAGHGPHARVMHFSAFHFSLFHYNLVLYNWGERERAPTLLMSCTYIRPYPSVHGRPPICACAKSGYRIFLNVYVINVVFRDLNISRREGYSSCFVIPSVCPSVRLLPRFLLLCATRWPISYTNGISATLALFMKWHFYKKMPRSKVMA